MLMNETKRVNYIIKRSGYRFCLIQRPIHGGAPVLAHFVAEIELEFDSDDMSPLCKRVRMQMSSTENRSI